MNAVAIAGSLSISRVARPVERKVSGHLEDGHAVMRVGDRIILVDLYDFKPNGSDEYLCADHDGALEIDRPTDGRFSPRSERLVSHSPELRDRVVVRRGVTAIGRIIRDY